MELSSKRAKAPSNPNQMVVVSCLVDGCNSDLSQCREYHRRHKVCEPHSKTPMVTIGGRQQRFCQQCSRFHSLEEFDEGKRSCRKRLDGHNRRRRKPQSDSLAKNTSGLFFSTPQGTRVLSFGSPQVLTNPAASSAWLGSVKSEMDGGSVMFNNNNNLSSKSSFPITTPSLVHSYKEMNQFQFIQGTATTSTNTNDHILPDVSSRLMFCDGINGAGNSSSDRALSLLSSTPASHTTDVGSSHVVPSLGIHGSLQFEGVGQMFFPYSQEIENKEVVSDGESSGTRRGHNTNISINNNTTLHFQGMFQDGSSASGGGDDSHQTLSFGW